MDLSVYYQKVREVEQSIADDFPIVVSQESQDGGKAGIRTEVSRRLGAKLWGPRGHRSDYTQPLPYQLTADRKY